MVMAGSWENVSLKVRPVQVREGARQGMTHTLRRLEVATDYLTVIRVRNKYGWSAESEHFSFSTKKGEPGAVNWRGWWMIVNNGKNISVLFFAISKILRVLYQQHVVRCC